MQKIIFAICMLGSRLLFDMLYTSPCFLGMLGKRVVIQMGWLLEGTFVLCLGRPLGGHLVKKKKNRYHYWYGFPHWSGNKDLRGNRVFPKCPGHVG